MERDTFLQQLRTRLGREAGPPPPVPRWAPPPELFYDDPAKCLAVFLENLEDLGVTAEVCPTRHDALARVAALVAERGWSRLVVWPGLAVPGLAARRTDEAARAEFGLVEADGALAETGSVVLSNGGARRRDTSLLPPVVGFLVPRSKIFSRLTDLARRMDTDPAGLPACVNLISGPSKTADIELELCIGVHGPGEVHVWVLDDE